MVFLALISGLINLSSQVVYQKIVSLLVGDLYTVFIAITLAFILGSAIGSYLGSFFRRYLAFIELATGLYNLLIALLLRQNFHGIEIPLGLVLLGLFLPAVGLGTHLPLYSYYFRKHRFSAIFALYHLGGALGLLAIEWHFVNAGSVALSVLLLGATQTLLALGIIRLQIRQAFLIDPSPHRISLYEWKSPSIFVPVLTVISACVLSFYTISWALKTQLMLTESFRLQATCVSIAIFVWMALAGGLRRVVKLHSGHLFLGMAASFAVITLAFQSTVLHLHDNINGSLLQYYGISAALAVFLTMPVFFSSLIFIFETDRLSQQWSVDVASGILNLVAGLGSLGGFVLAYFMAPWFWDKPYFLVAGAAAGVCAFLSSHKKVPALVLLPPILGLLLWAPPLNKPLFTHRTPKPLRHCQQYTDIQVFSHPQASMALLTWTSTAAQDCDPGSTAVQYVVDGHISHNLKDGLETYVGAAAGMYFQAPLKRSLVIGVGSGQSAFGTATISETTDLVEISPAVMDNLAVLKYYNFDILHRKNVNIVLADGFNYVRRCRPGSYDLILNTSTYASSFNAAKLYSREFAELASRCLSKHGVYHTYFDMNIAQTPREIYEFLAPIAMHFKFIDIFVDPYPQVFAYNFPLVPQVLTTKNFLHENDAQIVLKYMQDSIGLSPEISVNTDICVEYYPSLTLADISAGRISTLDRPILERNAIHNIVRKINSAVLLDSRNALEMTFKRKKSCLAKSK